MLSRASRKRGHSPRGHSHLGTQTFPSGPTRLVVPIDDFEVRRTAPCPSTSLRPRAPNVTSAPHRNAVAAIPSTPCSLLQFALHPPCMFRDFLAPSLAGQVGEFPSVLHAPTDFKRPRLFGDASHRDSGTDRHDSGCWPTPQGTQSSFYSRSELPSNRGLYELSPTLLSAPEYSDLLTRHNDSPLPLHARGSQPAGARHSLAILASYGRNPIFPAAGLPHFSNKMPESWRRTRQQ